MFLSFIVSVYNTEKYLDECLESLLNQDIPAEDYEIICINDGSTDRSLEILHRYAAEFPNIRIIDKENGGVSLARNTGLEAATGDYVWMVDSDDFIAGRILSGLKLTASEETPDIIDFGAYTFHDVLSEAEKESYSKNELPAVSFANHVYITRSLFSRKFLLHNKIRFDPAIVYSEDSLFKCECLMNQPRIVKIEKALYFVHFRKGSAVSLNTDKANTKKVESWYTAAVRFFEYYQKCDASLKSIMADLLMANLWSALAVLAQMERSRSSTYIEIMRKNKMFPFRRPKECTLTRSYSTERTDIIGKILDKLYMNQHTNIGFYAMRLWNTAYSIYCKL